MKSLPPRLVKSVEVAVQTLAAHALKGDEFNFWCACGEYHDTVEEWADHALHATLVAAVK